MKQSSTPGRSRSPTRPALRCAALLIAGAGLGLCGPAAAKNDAQAAPANITEEQATAVALKVMPGKVTGVTIEKKRGKNVYVVEVMTESKGEKDVFVDMVSGKVVGTD